MTDFAEETERAEDAALARLVGDPAPERRLEALRIALGIWRGPRPARRRQVLALALNLVRRLDYFARLELADHIVRTGSAPRALIAALGAGDPAMAGMLQGVEILDGEAAGPATRPDDRPVEAAAPAAEATPMSPPRREEAPAALDLDALLRHARADVERRRRSAPVEPPASPAGEPRVRSVPHLQILPPAPSPPSGHDLIDIALNGEPGELAKRLALRSGRSVSAVAGCLAAADAKALGALVRDAGCGPALLAVLAVARMRREDFAPNVVAAMCAWEMAEPQRPPLRAASR